MAAAASKTPSEVKDYTIDWTSDLGGDTISTSSWAASDPALVITTPPPAIGPNGTTTTGWFAGGVPGEVYTVTNTITTLAGRTLQDSFPMRIRQFNYI